MRDESVSISKALGIMLMVLAHSGFSQIGDAAINMFHMPLFFLMSGYCFNDRHLDNPKGFLIAKVRRIYFPYVKYALLFLLLHNLFYMLRIYGDVYSLHDFIFRGVHIIVSMGLHDQLLGGYWFMSDLFWGLIISYICLKSFHNKAAIGIFLSLTISMLMNAMEIHIPIISIHPSHFLAAAFIMAGIFYKRSGMTLELKPFVVWPVAIVLVTLGTYFWRGCVPILDTWKTIPYFTTAIAGTIGVFAFSKQLVRMDKTSLLTYFGGGTLTILTWHFLCFKLVTLVIIELYNLPMSKISEFPVIYDYANKGWWIAYFIVGVIFPFIIDQVITVCRNQLVVLVKKKK